VVLQPRDKLAYYPLAPCRSMRAVSGHSCMLSRTTSRYNFPTDYHEGDGYTNRPQRKSDPRTIAENFHPTLLSRPLRGFGQRRPH